VSHDFDWYLRHVDQHRGNCYDYDRWLHDAAERALEEGRQGIKKFASRTFQWIAFGPNLELAAEHLRLYGGASPGPDGLTFGSFDSDAQRYEYFRALGKEVRQGHYKSGSTKKVSIPKGSGRGKRTIEIQCLRDRIVHRGIAQVIQPILDPMFDDCSFGFRPKRGRLDALAHAERLAVDEKRVVPFQLCASSHSSTCRPISLLMGRCP
jgi:hypothetical protein